MKKLRKNKGITLIALVITIIVLLILAGVTIATLTGENGILNQANKAKTETTKASAKEQVEMEVLGSYGTDGILDNDLLKTNLKNISGVQGVPDAIDDTSFPLTVTVDGVKIDIDKDGTVSYTFDAEEWDKTACEESSFLWESDDPNSGEAYHKIIGYADSITNETKLKIPSRCHEIRSNVGNWNTLGRTFSANNFRDIEFPETIKIIGDNAFSGFICLTDLTIPNSVTVIDTAAFEGCTSLTSVTIPDSVVTISTSAFRNCTSLINIIISDNYAPMISSGGGEWSAFANTAWWNNQPNEELVYIGKVVYGYKGTMPNNTKIEIKEGTKSIGYSAFSNCTGLTSIIIPNTVTSIGHSAFSNCTGLSSITIPNSIISLDSWVFEGCCSLSNIAIPSSVTSIGYGTFRGCSNLSSITIPNNVIRIDDYAFWGWTSSQTVNIQGYSSAPSGWSTNWNTQCSATINWNQ